MFSLIRGRWHRIEGEQSECSAGLGFETDSITICSGTGMTTSAVSAKEHEQSRSRSTGKERDSESGNDYFGARYYASSMGRFLSPDDPDNDRHLGDPQSLNLYAYGRNNPLKNTDPDGEACIVAANGSRSNDNSGGESCADVDAADAKHPPSVVVHGTPGNIATSLLLNGFMALSNMAGDYFAGLTGLRAYQNDELSKDWTGTASNIGVNVAGLLVGPEGEAGEVINITEKGLQHVLERHAVGGAKSAGKSLFNAGADIKALIKAAESTVPERLPNGDLRFTVNAGQAIGVDRATGATSKYTVVTDSSRNLLTAHPGAYK